jgi:tetratricopeptide (TPR) repeat protein
MGAAQRVLILGVLTAGGIAVALALEQSKAPELPVLLDRDDLDPEVAALIDRTLDEAHRSPRSPATRAKLAMVYHANGFSSLAANAYEQAIELDDRDPHLWYGLALARAEQSDVEGALNAVDRAIAMQPSYAPPHWHRGMWLLDVGRLDEAERSFRALIELDADSAAGRIGLARTSLQRKQYAEAAASLRDVLAAAPPGAQTPNLEYVLQLLSAAERNLRKGLSSARHVAQIDGSRVEWPDEWKAQILHHRVGYRAALDELEHLVATRRYKEAIARAEDLLARNPRDAVVMNWLAIALISTNQVDDGIGILKEALECDPAYFRTYLNLSHCCYAKGDATGAMDHARRAVEMNPAAGEAHVALGRLLIAANRNDDAAASLIRAVELGTNSADVRVLLGQTLIKLRRWAQAAETLEYAGAAASNPAEAYAALALARAECGKLEQARQALQQAANLNPGLPALNPVAARIRELESRGARP